MKNAIKSNKNPYFFTALHFKILTNKFIQNNLHNFNVLVAKCGDAIKSFGTVARFPVALVKKTISQNSIEVI